MHLIRVKKVEHRKDKYGQNIRVTCTCGIQTNWHTDEKRARSALWDIHAE